ncbi:MAG: esterase-like activity of phytase family protein [Pseudomonadota bacterium]
MSLRPFYSLMGLMAVLAMAGCGMAGSSNPEPTGQPWRLSDHADRLRAASCPDGVAFERAPALTINVVSLDMSGLQPNRHLFGNTRVIGGWELTSEDPTFGGLSGLAVYPSGNLLAVSDQGAFIWINIENNAPTSAHMAPMLGPSGTALDGKDVTDAEGVTLADGLALVSFERSHRIEAFDLEGCGAAARAARIADLPDQVYGLSGSMRPTGGAEALSYSPGLKELLIGIESSGGFGQPMGRFDDAGVAVMTDRLEAPAEFALTGLDTARFHPFALFRHYTARSGNRNIIAYVDGAATPPNSLVDRVRLDPSVPVDNFEGIAVQNLDTRTQRIWIVSDDNFSERQRTLIMAFDIN